MKIQHFTPVEQTKKEKNGWYTQKCIDDYKIESYCVHDYFWKRQLQNIQGAFMVIHNKLYTTKDISMEVSINVLWYIFA